MNYREELEQAALRQPYSLLGFKEGRAVVIENSTGRYFTGNPRNWRDSSQWKPTRLRDEPVRFKPIEPLRIG